MERADPPRHTDLIPAIGELQFELGFWQGARAVAVITREENRTLTCCALDAHAWDRTGEKAVFNARRIAVRSSGPASSARCSGRPTSPPGGSQIQVGQHGGRTPPRNVRCRRLEADRNACPPGADPRSHIHTKRTNRSRGASLLLLFAEILAEPVHHEVSVDPCPGREVGCAVAKNVHGCARVRQALDQGVQDRLGNHPRRRRERLGCRWQRGSIRCHTREATTRVAGRQNEGHPASTMGALRSERLGRVWWRGQVLGRSSSSRGSSQRVSSDRRLATS